jgi:hypothetical protein
MGWSCSSSRWPEKAPLDLLLFVALAFFFPRFQPKKRMSSPESSKPFINKEIGVAICLDQAATIKIVGKNKTHSGLLKA